MKRLIFFLLAITMVSCGRSWYDGLDDPEVMNVKKEQRDSIYYKNYMDSVANVYQQMYDSAQVDDSVRCHLMVEGKVIVDGGRTVDISSSAITVDTVIVRVWLDGQHGPTVFYPEISREVGEPEVMDWDFFPEGVVYNKKRLLSKMVEFAYKNSVYIEVEVCYNVRGRGEELNKKGCDKYWAEAKFTTTEYKEDYFNFLVPLELATMGFNASVKDTEDAW